MRAERVWSYGREFLGTDPDQFDGIIPDVQGARKNLMCLHGGHVRHLSVLITGNLLCRLAQGAEGLRTAESKERPGVVY